MQSTTVASVFPFLLSALLLLIPLQHAAQAADNDFPGSNSLAASTQEPAAGSSANYPCPSLVFSQDKPAPDVLTSIPASAEICAPYKEVKTSDKVTYYYIRMNTPLRPSNLIYDPPGTATGSGSTDDPNLKITWNCPVADGIKQIDFPESCDGTFPDNIGMPAFPISAMVNFDYDYTISTSNEQILFATSIDTSNLYRLELPIATLDAQILEESEEVEGVVKPKLASATMICSDGSFVKPPIPCKRRS